MTNLTKINDAKIHVLLMEMINNPCEWRIFPPKEVNSKVLRSDTIAEDLKYTSWWLEINQDTEELLSFTELMVLLYKLRYLFQALEEQSENARETIVRVPPVAIEDLLEPLKVRELLNAVELEGFGGSSDMYFARFPIYALVMTGARDSDLLAVEHPQSGDSTLLIFTDEDGARQFAEQFGGVRVVKLAETPTALQQVLRRSKNQVVAFDPLMHDHELLVKVQTRISNFKN
jgi:hypothetical protein